MDSPSSDAGLKSGKPTFGLLEPAALAAMPGLDFLRGLTDGTMPGPPFAETSGVAPVSVEHGRVVFTGNPASRFYNQMGTIHGGWTALLLDTAMGCAVHSVLSAGSVYTTIEMKTVYVRALREKDGPVTCEANLIHKGAQIASAEGKILDREGRLIAYGSETCFIRSLVAARV